MSRRDSWFANWDPSTRLLLRQALVGVLVTCFVGLLLVGVWHGTRLHTVTIGTVTAHDGPTVDAAVVEGLVGAQLDGSYFRLIPRTFAWLYPEQAITQTLLDQERIKTVDMDVRDGTELLVSFTEHIPTALWCAENAQEPCLFVNETGYAFTTAPQLRGGSFMRYVTPGRAPALGEVMASPALLADTAWFLDKMGSVLQLYPERVHLYGDGRVTYELSHGGTIMVADRHDPIDTFRYLETLVQSEEYQGLTDEPFQYVDLRFGNKLFVNRTIATSTASSSAATSTPVILSEESVAAELPVATSTTEE